MGASVGSEFISFSPSFVLVSMWLSTSFYIPTPVLFHLLGLDLLKKVGALWEEAQKLEMEAQYLEAEGLEKMEAAVAGSEVEGF